MPVPSDLSVTRDAPSPPPQSLRPVARGGEPAVASDGRTCTRLLALAAGDAAHRRGTGRQRRPDARAGYREGIRYQGRIGAARASRERRHAAKPQSARRRQGRPRGRARRPRHALRRQFRRDPAPELCGAVGADGAQGRAQVEGHGDRVAQRPPHRHRRPWRCQSQSAARHPGRVRRQSAEGDDDPVRHRPHLRDDPGHHARRLHDGGRARRQGYRRDDCRHHAPARRSEIPLRRRLRGHCRAASAL